MINQLPDLYANSGLYAQLMGAADRIADLEISIDEANKHLDNIDHATTQSRLNYMEAGKHYPANSITMIQLRSRTIILHNSCEDARDSLRAYQDALANEWINAYYLLAQVGYAHSNTPDDITTAEQLKNYAQSNL